MWHFVVVIIFYFIPRKGPNAGPTSSRGSRQGSKRINIKIMLMFARGEARSSASRDGMAMAQAKAVRLPAKALKVGHGYGAQAQAQAQDPLGTHISNIVNEMWRNLQNSKHKKPTKRNDRCHRWWWLFSSCSSNGRSAIAGFQRGEMGVWVYLFVPRQAAGSIWRKVNVTWHVSFAKWVTSTLTQLPVC